MNTLRFLKKVNNNKYIIFAYGVAGVLILNKLFSLGIKKNNIYVITHKKKLGMNTTFFEFLKFHQIKFDIFENKNFFLKIKRFKANLLFSIYFRKKIPNKILNLVNFRAINLHPSFLPNYKGAFSIPWMIYNNEKFAGFTYHYMNSKFDSGNIIYQKKIKINSNDTSFSLYNRIIYKSIIYIEKILKKPLNGKDGKVQKFKGTYYGREMPEKCELKLENSLNLNSRIIRLSYFPPFKPSFLRHKSRIIYFNTIKKFKIFVDNIKKS
jgi:methionyl-tRNA formyltransferase